MRTIKHGDSFPIYNCDKLTNESVESKINKRHGDLFPNYLRCLITGSSNCGKTNILLTMLLRKNGIRFENIYLYSKSLQQAKYLYLKEVCRNINNLNYYEFENVNDETILTPDKTKPNSVLIFDDIACSPQSVIKEYFSMGRHYKLDSFYLCQSYTRIPKQLLRDNANFLILFKQDDLNLQHVHRDHVNSDMTFVKFKSICSTCWNVKFGFIIIDKEREINNGRYRQGFDLFIIID